MLGLGDWNLQRRRGGAVRRNREIEINFLFIHLYLQVILKMHMKKLNVKIIKSNLIDNFTIT